MKIPMVGDTDFSDDVAGLRRAVGSGRQAARGMWGQLGTYTHGRQMAVGGAALGMGASAAMIHHHRNKQSSARQSGFYNGN